MNRQDIEEHIDAKIALMMIDSEHATDGEGYSEREIAEYTGLSTYEVLNIKNRALKKLGLNPVAWECMTLPYR